MWATPTRVNPIPDLSRYLDVFRMRGIEGAHDIGPAEVDVEGEVVPGPGGHAHVGDVVLNGDCHHRCLRSVTPGDAVASAPLSTAASATSNRLSPR